MSENILNLVGLQGFDGLKVSLINFDSTLAIVELEVKGGKEELRKANAQILFGVTSAEFEGLQVKLIGSRSTWSDDRTSMRFEAAYFPA
jgi:hypothetical protein